MRRREFTAATIAATGLTFVGGAVGRRSAAAAEPVVLRLLHKWPEPNNMRFFRAAVAEFEAAHPGVRINMEAVADQPYKAKIRVIMASGQIPDIYFTWVGEYTREFIRAGRVLDITKYLAAPEGQGRFAPATLDAYRTDGKLYGVPVEVDAKFMVYNKPLFEKVGVTVPPADWPALRWSIAIIRYCPAYAVSGLIAAISHSGTLERIPPGASVSMGNPVPCSVYQIFVSPLSTYGTGVSSRYCDSVTQPRPGPPPACPVPAPRPISRPAAPCAWPSRMRAPRSTTTSPLM